jgi:hypothetical protein
MLEGGIRPMLCWISIVGGLLIMMGQHARSEAFDPPKPPLQVIA